MSNWRGFLGQRHGVMVPGTTEFEAREFQGQPDFGQQTQKSVNIEAIPAGEPTDPWSVRSVYDSRPVNAQDFNVSAFKVVAFNPPSTTFAGIITFTVPPGYRYVPREWDISISPDTGTTVQDTTADIMWAGGISPFNANVIIGNGGTIKTFFVVDENQTFGVRVKSPSAPAGTLTLIVSCYGNALPNTGVQAPYQIANRG